MSAVALGQIEQRVDRALIGCAPGCNHHDSLVEIRDQVHALRCAAQAAPAGTGVRVVITLDDVDLVEQIADQNGVGVVCFEGLNACVLIDEETGVVTTFQALDPDHRPAVVLR